MSAALLSGGAGLPWPTTEAKQHGIHASAYQGRHFEAEHEEIRRCIVKRESEGQYNVINPTGSYRGAYQVSKPMGVGMGWMIQKELRHVGVDANTARWIGRELRSTPVNRWHRFYQDMGFWLVWDDGQGRSHWAGGRWHCG